MLICGIVGQFRLLRGKVLQVDAYEMNINCLIAALLLVYPLTL